MLNQIWIDGVARPVNSVQFEICVGELPWPSDEDKKTHGADPRGVSYSLRIVVDEHSGEDGAPSPSSECLPVWRTAGGRHPSLTELATMTISDGVGWNAWFGNDAQPLRENQIRFDGWRTPTRLRVAWSAKYEDDPRWFVHPDGPTPGLMKYEGEAEFAGMKMCVDHPEDADRVVASIWGNQQLAALERTDLQWMVLRELRPNLHRRLPDFLGRWLAGMTIFRGLRRRVLSVVYRPKLDA